MDDELKNILSQFDANPEMDDGKLMDYVNKQLTHEEQHELEKQMNDDEFVSDAMEGLQGMKNTEGVPAMVHQLNTGLKRQLKKNKRTKRQNFFKEGPWIYFSIILLLVLAVAAFVVIKKFVAV
jgi:ABC-type bacteriocin/lantibiotic exporter with double-glycine peptidase domain